MKKQKSAPKPPRDREIHQGGYSRHSTKQEKTKYEK